jgi:hypothetical protein
MLSRWRPGRPWAGRGSVPGGRFDERLTPGREAERSAECQDNSHDAAWKLPLARTITARVYSPRGQAKSCQFCQ